MLSWEGSLFDSSIPHVLYGCIAVLGLHLSRLAGAGDTSASLCKATPLNF